LCLEKWSHGGGEAGAALGGGARRGSGSLKGWRRPRCFSPKEEEGSGGQVGRLGRAGYEASGPGWWDGGLGGLGRPASQGRKSGWAR
jgi:hypothetical protein